MAESITIRFEGRKVGIQYHPEISEAELHDEMRACELAIHAMVAKSIRNRQQVGIAVPEVLVALFNAHTFHELL